MKSTSEVDLKNRLIMNYEDINKYAIASASVPVAFAPTVIDGHMFVDGMTAYNLNVQEAIDRCHDLGFDDNQIVIDMLVCKVTKDLNQWNSGFNAYQNFMYARSINNDVHDDDAVAGVKRANPDINFRLEIYQSVKATGTDELTFTTEVTGPLQAAGKEDAQLALANLEQSRNSQ